MAYFSSCQGEETQRHMGSHNANSQLEKEKQAETPAGEEDTPGNKNHFLN